MSEFLVILLVPAVVALALWCWRLQNAVRHLRGELKQTQDATLQSHEQILKKVIETNTVVRSVAVDGAAVRNELRDFLHGLRERTL